MSKRMFQESYTEKQYGHKSRNAQKQDKNEIVPLELTRAECEIIKAAIHFLGIILYIIGIVFVLCIGLLALAALFFGLSFLYSLVS